jgi:hypothetical protein
MTVPDALVSTFDKKDLTPFPQQGFSHTSALRFRGRLPTTRLLPVDTFFARSDGTLFVGMDGTL